MTIRASMREAASSARRALGRPEDVVDFLIQHLCDDGGFAGRSPGPDLYYTVFALASLEALAAEMPPSTAAFLARLGDGDGLDLVHLAALARCWAHLRDGGADEPARRGMLARLAEMRCRCGGFTHAGDAETPTPYGCFLAVGAMQDLRAGTLPGAWIGQCIEAMRSADGAYANAANMPTGSTTATAAAVVTLRQLDLPLGPQVAPWLLSQCRNGGFLAAPAAPAADLLSTATALHALAALGAPLDDIREPCLDYVDSLWTGCAFRGHWADETPDCEYTFYGLLALGQLTM